MTPPYRSSLAGFRVLFDFVGARGVFSSINETFSRSTIRLGMNLLACCSSRMLDREPSFSQGVDGLSPESRIKDAGQNLCGLGIAFKPDKRGNLFVKRLVPGGPADTSKLIEVSGSAGCSNASGGCAAPARPALLGLGARACQGHHRACVATHNARAAPEGAPACVSAPALAAGGRRAACGGREKCDRNEQAGSGEFAHGACGE